MTRSIVTAKKQDYSTPQHLVDHWQKEYGLNTDLCAQPYNARLPNFISPEQDSLKTLWEAPTRGYCNPPYGKIENWLKHGVMSCSKGAFSMYLIPVNTDTQWFHKYAMHGQVDLFEGRINFLDLTPAELEVERLLQASPTPKNARKIAWRLLQMQHEGTLDLNSEPVHRGALRCTDVLGADWHHVVEEEKPPGSAYPVMLVIFDPAAPPGPKPFRRRSAKTGALI